MTKYLCFKSIIKNPEHGHYCSTMWLICKIFLKKFV